MTTVTTGVCRVPTRTRNLHPVPDLPQLRPPDPPMVPVALAGSGIWAVVGLALLAAGAPDLWLWTCLAGFLLGLAALPVLAAHDLRQR